MTKVKKVLESQSLPDVLALGHMIGQNIQPGTVTVLSGDLGAGKTQLAAAIAAGMDIGETITSPTFALLKHYGTGRIPLNHMDIYRLENAAQLDDLDFWDVLRPGEPSATLIEWGDMFTEVVDVADIVITLRAGAGAGAGVDTAGGNAGTELRAIELQAKSPQGEALIAAVESGTATENSAVSGSSTMVKNDLVAEGSPAAESSET
ncbi:MAG: tRNA (adenosine(37)-N6)-threonylcarbamoyltransferase complex ATPase subunit type 1 TsaE [Coriobacteriia bacterium]|nr:tRNA (adenosine(37)-N6)-threonylcarbamoyltransferase complex ATPase subunit type 1 TsaE [Coriobacteriia bacterium]MCL2870443.1 tRNA (adenosine(37)-N6)-threonylcarbamoyltransferase complex ATPase subunit type 1 TsaE [Coriobacteriia bacterium]